MIKTENTQSTRVCFAYREMFARSQMMNKLLSGSPAIHPSSVTTFSGYMSRPFTLTSEAVLDSLVNPRCMSSDCGRKLEGTQRKPTYKLCTE